jgi:hypothetical protein
VNCLLDEPLIERNKYQRVTRHSVIISNIIQEIRCDICSRLITNVRLARACSKYKEILLGFLTTREHSELNNTYNLARTDPVVIVFHDDIGPI